MFRHSYTDNYSLDTTSLLQYYISSKYYFCTIFLSYIIFHSYNIWLKPQAMNSFLCLKNPYISFLVKYQIFKYSFTGTLGDTGNSTLNYQLFNINCQLWHILQLNTKYYVNLNQYPISHGHLIRGSSGVPWHNGKNTIQNRNRKYSTENIANLITVITLFSETFLNLRIGFSHKFKISLLNLCDFSGPTVLVIIINAKLINLIRFVHLNLSALLFLLKLLGGNPTIMHCSLHEHYLNTCQMLEYSAERLEYILNTYSLNKGSASRISELSTLIQYLSLSGDCVVQGEDAPPMDINDESVT